MRGEWIEMAVILTVSTKPPSLPMRGEWIEITNILPNTNLATSLPMRGEWIEIVHEVELAGTAPVSPHAGRVD